MLGCVNGGLFYFLWKGGTEFLSIIEVTFRLQILYVVVYTITLLLHFIQCRIFCRMTCISVTSTDTKKLECLQWEFVARCCNWYLGSSGHSYAIVLQWLTLQVLHKRRLNWTFFCLFVCLWRGDSKSCLSAVNIIEFSPVTSKTFLCSVLICLLQTVPSRAATVTYSVCNNFGFFRTQIITLRYIIFSFTS
jgi:hypothetical protein